MMQKNKIAVLLVTMGLGACVPPAHNVQQTDQVRQQNLQLLNEFSEFKKELRFLRGSVEEMQFETDNMQRRQEDVFEDFNRRLIQLETRAGISSQQNSVSNTDQVDYSNEYNAQQTAEIVSPAPDENNQINNAVDANQPEQIDNTSVVPPDQAVSNNSLSVLEQKVYDNAIEKLQQGRYSEATEGFQRLVEDWPQSDLADDSYYYMGEAQYVNRQYEQALASFREVVNNYQDSPRLPDATLKVGMIQYDVGAYNDAKETFRSLLSQFPEHPSAETARTRLLRIEQTIE